MKDLFAYREYQIAADGFVTKFYRIDTGSPEMTVIAERKNYVQGEIYTGFVGLYYHERYNQFIFLSYQANLNHYTGQNMCDFYTADSLENDDLAILNLEAFSKGDFIDQSGVQFENLKKRQRQVSKERRIASLTGIAKSPPSAPAFVHEPEGAVLARYTYGEYLVEANGRKVSLSKAEYAEWRKYMKARDKYEAAQKELATRV